MSFESDREYGQYEVPGFSNKRMHQVEEAEAANIRLCGRFFRQWIDPHSRSFEIHALGASVAAATSKQVE